MRNGLGPGTGVDRLGCGRKGIVISAGWVTVAIVMIVALDGGLKVVLFGRVLCHQPGKSGRRNGGEGRRSGRRKRGHKPLYY